MSKHKAPGKPSSSVVEFPEAKAKSQSVEVQASEWLAKLDVENPSEQARQDFKLWVNADAAHRKAFEEIVSFWDEMNILTQAILPRELASAVDVKRVLNKKSHPGLGWFKSGYVLSGVLVFVLVVTSALFFPSWQQAQTVDAIIYTTQVGEQRMIVLADRSAVLLNTNSQLEVLYDDNTRHLTLVRGEAHFDVFPDSGRPFEVYAGNGLVRAIGTAFTVHLRKADVEVIVTEGTVEIGQVESVAGNTPFNNPDTVRPDAGQLVADNASSASFKEEKTVLLTAGIHVKAGNKALYDRKTIGEVKPVVADQIEAQLAWQKGMLVFNGESLAVAVEEIGRYTPLKIVIPERKVRELKVGGLFKVGDTDSLFEALRDGFDVHVREISDDVVYLISSENR